MNKKEEIRENPLNDDPVDCSNLLSSLEDYVDGDLSPELCAELEKHMRECQRCRVVVNTVQKTVELYQEVADETPMPAEVRERLYLSLNLENYLKK